VFPFAGAVVGAARFARFVVFFADAFFALFADAFFFRIVMGANMSLHLDVSGNNLPRRARDSDRVCTGHERPTVRVYRAAIDRPRHWRRAFGA
jgi:hypothetical protein